MLGPARAAVTALCTPGPLFPQVLVDVGFLDFKLLLLEPSEGEIWGLIVYSVPSEGRLEIYESLEVF